MNLEYKELLDAGFHPQSRVWVYQSSRIFTLSEALNIEEQINVFTNQWQSHGADVKAAGYLFFGQFLILMADETQAGVSGCSTDSSVRFVKQLENMYQVSFFDRTNIAFVVKDKVQVLPLSQVQYAVNQQFITPETLYFNNMVLTKEQLENEWLIPASQNWLAQKIKWPEQQSITAD